MGSPAVMAIKVIGDTKNANKAFSGLEKRVHNFSKKFGAAAPIVKAGMFAIAAAAPAAAIAGTKALYDLGKEFKALEDTIRVGTGASGEALDGLVDVAKNIGAKVPAEFDEIATAVADLNTSLGYSGETLETVGAQVVQLGRLTGEQVNIRDLSATLSGFGVAAEDAEEAMDNLFRVSQATGVPVNELTAKLKTQGGVLTSVGFSFEDGAALLGVLSKAGVNADTVIKGMGQGLVRLAQDGEAPSETFRRVVGEIDGLVKSGDEAAALTMSGKVFGTRGATQFVSALKSGKFAFEDLDKIAGMTDDTIMGLGKETMNAAEHWQVLKNNVKLALEPLGSAVFRSVGAALGKVVELVQNFDLSKMTSGLQHPVLAAAAGKFSEIATAVADLGRMIGNYAGLLVDTAGPALSILLDTVINVAGTLLSVIGGALNVIGGAVRVFLSLLTGDWSGAWDGILQIISGWKTIITGIFSGAWAAIKGIFSAGLTLLSSLWSNAWSGISRLVSSAWSGISRAVSSGVSTAVSTVRGLPGRALSALGNVGSTLYQSGKDLVSGFIRGIGAMGSALYDAAKNIAKSAVDAVKSFLGISSPSRVFMGLGEDTARGFQVGLHSETSGVQASMRRMVNPPRVPRAPYQLRHSHGTPAQVVHHYEITVNGAVDKMAAAREIKNLLDRLERSSGVVAV